MNLLEKIAKHASPSIKRRASNVPLGQKTSSTQLTNNKEGVDQEDFITGPASGQTSVLRKVTGEPRKGSLLARIYDDAYKKEVMTAKAAGRSIPTREQFDSRNRTQAGEDELNVKQLGVDISQAENIPMRTATKPIEIEESVEEDECGADVSEDDSQGEIEGITCAQSALPDFGIPASANNESSLPHECETDNVTKGTGRLSSSGVAGTYPVHAFGSLADLIMLIAKCVQVSPAMVGSSIIGILAALVQALFNVSAKMMDKGMPTSLNMFIIAKSGDRKSSTIQAVAKPVYDAIRHADDSRRHMIVQDVTADGLNVGLIHRCSSQLLLALEGASLLGSHAMSKDSQMRFIGNMSSLFSGETLIRTRVAEHYCAEDRRLSVVLFAQPLIANEFLGSDLVMQQGFGCRFMYAAPESLRGTRMYVEHELESDPVYIDYCAKMTALASMAWEIDAETGGVNTRTIRTSPGAKQVWVAFYNQHELASGDGGDLATYADYASRFAEQVLRLAALLTIFDDINATEIPTEVMERAVELGEYYLGSAMTLFNDTPANNEEGHAQILLDWMRKKQLEHRIPAIPVRMIYKDGPRCARPSKKTRDLLEILEGREEVVKYEQGVRYGTGKLSGDNYAVTP